VSGFSLSFGRALKYGVGGRDRRFGRLDDDVAAPFGQDVPGFAEVHFVGFFGGDPQGLALVDLGLAPAVVLGDLGNLQRQFGLVVASTTRSTPLASSCRDGSIRCSSDRPSRSSLVTMSWSPGRLPVSSALPSSGRLAGAGGGGGLVADRAAGGVEIQLGGAGAAVGPAQLTLASVVTAISGWPAVPTEGWSAPKQEALRLGAVLPLWIHGL
jgi:hypothetical protein